MSEMTLCGRIFSDAELEIIREITQKERINRNQISHEVCRVLNWFKPDGKLKEMSCRVALLRLHRLGILELPPPLNSNSNGSRHRSMVFTSTSDPGIPINGSAIRSWGDPTCPRYATETLAFME